MVQTKAGGQKYKQTMIAKHGSLKAWREYMKGLGSKGGKTPTLLPKGFAAATEEQRSEWGKRGGTRSKRGKNKNSRNSIDI